VPPVLARFAGFDGHLEYAGHRTDAPGAPEVRGIATVSDGSFVLEERAANYILRADDSGAVVRSGAITARTSDPLDADVLINPWVVAMGALARGEFASLGHGAWRAPNGLIIYTDATGTSIIGMTSGSQRPLAFTFTGWADVAGLALPTRILRLRRGIADASLQIDRLDVVADAARTASRITQVGGTRSADASMPAPGAAPGLAAVSPSFPWRLMLTLFGSMLLAVAIIAWLHRDAFATRLCVKRAEDPRAWRGVASAAYVSADGILSFEGNKYRVGPAFYQRSVEVQHSALFVRVRAPGVTHMVVLPRRLPKLVPERRRIKRRAAAPGLSLIETLVAVAFFAVVIVAAVYPTLITVAQADFVAAQKRAALLAAANALADEEAACAYGRAAAIGDTTTSVNGMTVVVAVAESSVPGARDITVSSRDASGRVLVTLATTVGPPVPPPATGLPPTQRDR
jgi:hypothetical protein